ncbi:hypothetical protein ACFFJX_11335 [Pseudarcicella hirudinis]|uniref:hypothetical protein n=1 Tax=Pseudarcicella hirudinis TaxID=1079859 RepID=UPI0035E98AEF
MQKIKKSLFFIASAIMLCNASFAQDKKPFLYSNRISILAGLIQPMVLKGGNIEITYFRVLIIHMAFSGNVWRNNYR